jgi:hypothetical protein
MFYQLKYCFKNLKEVIMKNYSKIAILSILVASAATVANIRQTIMPNFHWLYVDFATTTTSGHGEYSTDNGAKYVELALNGNACYDIKTENSTTQNPDIIFKIWTNNQGEFTLDDDGPGGSMHPQALLWITQPTLLKVRAYSYNHNSADFMVYSYINTTATSASACAALDGDRPFYNGVSGNIERNSTSAD